ncbi:MAG TPA: M3 family metallopeptidase [Alphaproteobacteria bacterium]|nr:M3 family metallopeptidase [Alphaproteobacteria bacterium]
MTTTQAFTGAVTAENDVLPVWDFGKFYPDPASPEFEDEFKALEVWSASFADRFEGKINTLDGDQLAAAIAENINIDDLAGKLLVYVSLKAVQDSEVYAQAEEDANTRYSKLAAQGAFFAHEIKELGEDKVKAMLAASEKLREFEPMLESLLEDIPHTPPLDVTKYGAEAAAISGWVALYDKLAANKRYTFEGKELNETQILHIFTNDPDRERRKAAHEVFMEGFRNSRESLISAHIFNEMLRLKNVDDKWENYDQPWDSMHMANGVTTAMVDALESAVKDSYGSIFQRMYRLKAALMGLPALEIYDRNTNPLEALGADAKDAYIPFGIAKAIVLNSYREFSPTVADVAQKFFDENWIDAPVGENKRGGAFAAPGAARLVNPMVMLNYKGSPRDVATMSHELGHGVHQYLAAFKGDRILSSPLTFAETASVFGEMLTFKSLLAAAQTDDARRRLLADKVNDMTNTLFRQISFHVFEKRCHTQVKETGKALSAEEIAAHFKASVAESYGDTINLPEDYGIIYPYISHFHHSPFYVYAYAFGDALVNALYQVYEEGSVPDFEKKYIEMLELGGTLTPDWLKENFGLDITDPEFWKKGIKTIDAMLTELEVLCQPLLKPAVENAPAPGVA